MSSPTKIIRGKRIYLRVLEVGDVGPAYLGWMNDKKIQAYTRRRGAKTTAKELKDFIRAGKKTSDVHFAVILSEGDKHIGNIFLNSVNQLNKTADLTVMLGDAREQGKGYAAEAIQLLSGYAFRSLALRRLSAGSPNPRFNALMQKIGWKEEGVEREAFRFGKEYIDVVRWGLLKKEFHL